MRRPGWWRAWACFWKGHDMHQVAKAGWEWKCSRCTHTVRVHISY